MSLIFIDDQIRCFSHGSFGASCSRSALIQAFLTFYITIWWFKSRCLEQRSSRRSHVNRCNFYPLFIKLGSNSFLCCVQARYIRRDRSSMLWVSKASRARENIGTSKWIKRIHIKGSCSKLYWAAYQPKRANGSQFLRKDWVWSETPH